MNGNFSENDKQFIISFARFIELNLVLSDEDAYISEHDLLIIGFMEIILECGWPKISKDGLKVSKAAWTIAMSADHDIEFQKKCVEFMKSCGPEDVIDADIAILEKCIRSNEAAAIAQSN